jgi:hypothetical protein
MLQNSIQERGSAKWCIIFAESKPDWEGSVDERTIKILHLCKKLALPVAVVGENFPMSTLEDYISAEANCFLLTPFTPHIRDALTPVRPPLLVSPLSVSTNTMLY